MQQFPKCTINNFRYDKESTGPSQYWQSHHFHENQFKFPFSSDELINQIRNFITISEEGLLKDKVLYRDDSIRGIYVFGSRVSKTNVNDSDFDLIMIVDDFYSHCIDYETRYSNNLQYLLKSSIKCNCDDEEGKLEEKEYDMEVHIMETSFFVEHVYSQLPIFMLSVLQPNSSFVLFEDEKMKLWRHHWSLWFLRISRTKNSFLHELHHCFNKAFRFWNVLENKLCKDESERKSTLKKVKKNLAHGIRYSKYAYQFVNSGIIYDYTETNKLYDSIVFHTDSFSSWNEYKQISDALYKTWKEQLKDDLKNIIKDALFKCKNSESNSSLGIQNFLNTYSSGFEKDNPLFSELIMVVEHNYELDFSHHYKYGPYSLMRLLSVNVTPIIRSKEEHLNPNSSQLFKIDCDMEYISLELCKLFLECRSYLECNGTVLSYNIDDNGKIVYTPVCVPRFYAMDYNFILEKVGSDYFSDIDMSPIQILERPVGIRCSLFFYSGEWRFVFDDEKDNWISKWILKNFDMSRTEQEFENLFERIGMKYPSHEDQMLNFFFIYQKNSNRIIYCGCRNLESMMEYENWIDFSTKYNWNDFVKSYSDIGFLELQDFVNDFEKFSPLEYEGLEFVNFKQPYKCFILKSSLHSNIPSLRLCNVNYLISKLDKYVLENPPYELTSSKYNDTRIVSSIMQSKFSSQVNEDHLVNNLNPLFTKPFSQFKNIYIELCQSINIFYNEQLLSIEQDIKQFNETAKKYLRGNLVGLFYNLKKFRKEQNCADINVANYWRNLSFSNRENPSTTHNTINFQEVRQVLELISIYKNHINNLSGN